MSHPPDFSPARELANLIKQLITHVDLGKHLSQRAFSRRRDSNLENLELPVDKVSRETLGTCLISLVKLPLGSPRFFTSGCLQWGVPALGHVAASPPGGSGAKFLRPQEAAQPSLLDVNRKRRV